VKKITSSPKPLELRFRALSMGLIFLFDGLYITNCLAPYLGFKFNFSQTMYSGLLPTAENHLFFPKIPIFQDDTYAFVTSIDIVGAETVHRKNFEAFVESTRNSGQFIHLNILKYHLDRICREENTSIAIEYQTYWKQRVNLADACVTPSMRQYSSVQLYPSCWPSCIDELTRWAREAGGSGTLQR
jgi:hypothetical protein